MTLVPALVATICAGLMASFARMPWFAVAAFPGLGVAFALAEVFKKPKAAFLIATFSGLLSLVIPIRVLFGADEDFASHWPTLLCAASAWGLCISFLPALLSQHKAKPTVLSVIALVVALTCGCLWVGNTYVEALRRPFYLSIAPNVCVILLLRQRFEGSVTFIQVANTCLLILVGIPLVDLFWKPPGLAAAPTSAEKFYSYELARKDPIAFERWWKFFMGHTREALHQVLQEDTRRLAPARTIPGAKATLFDSQISINQLGFRGPEISKEKGDAYRIVALGESTTFGFTLAKDDLPWPRVLENLIRERIAGSRKVEVINAGLPGFTIHDNIRRFPADIAPLKPDMILSFHGYNGFPFLDEALPPLVNAKPPSFRPRALRLLQQAEYRARLLHFRRTQVSRPDPSFWPAPVTGTRYAKFYEELYQLANQQGAKLVVGSSSMAVNGSSDPDVVEFYYLGFPAVRWSILANKAHNELVRTFAQSHPDVLFADIQRDLDGHHEKFIDLVHLTQTGRDHIADKFYAVIEPILKEQLSEKRPVMPLGADL